MKDQAQKHGADGAASGGDGRLLGLGAVLTATRRRT
jgi:hypothetical protein